MACPRKERARFLRELRAARLAQKQERRAARERALGEKIRAENVRRGFPDAQLAPGERRIVGWIAGLPIIKLG